MTLDQLKVLGYSFSISCTGYFVEHNGVGVGGATTLGTSTHTSDGRRKHWAHIKADRAMYTEEAIRTATNHYYRSAPHD